MCMMNIVRDYTMIGVIKNVDTPRADSGLIYVISHEICTRLVWGLAYLQFAVEVYDIFIGIP